jgi:hypothetical protein
MSRCKQKGEDGCSKSCLLRPLALSAADITCLLQQIKQLEAGLESADKVHRREDILLDLLSEVLRL